MTDAPVFDIDPSAFWDDPYPQLAAMRARAPVAHVPQLGAMLITRHADVVANERRTQVFSSVQPEGLMTRLMGQNLMRKDGADHQAERRAIFPSVSPRTVRDVWTGAFQVATDRALAALRPAGRGDLVRDFAMPVAAEALKAMTGLTNMSAALMDSVSQGMIDGCANYAGDPAVEARCHDCTAAIDAHIDARLPALQVAPDLSLISVQLSAGLSPAQMRANVKLAISGGVNETRDAIAGTAWALMRHPGQLAAVRSGAASWAQAFDEYARWMSPIGMSPREVARAGQVAGVDLAPGTRVFFMFGSANRDAAVFAAPDDFDIARDGTAAIPFGAGPHFCAGAWAARALIGDVALPALFDALPGVRLDAGADTRFGGWAFRGPLRVPVCWDV